MQVCFRKHKNNKQCVRGKVQLEEGRKAMVVVGTKGTVPNNGWQVMGSWWGSGRQNGM